MSTLRDGEWVEALLMDNVILFEWLDMPSSTVYWIPFSISRILQGPDKCMTSEEHKTIRAYLNLPTTGALEMRNVVVGVLSSDHYFVVNFDYAKRHAHVLGRFLKAVRYGSDDWDQWGGPFLWTRIAGIFGWDESPTTAASVVRPGLSWIQVSTLMCYI
jgi:hypothetical protein